MDEKTIRTLEYPRILDRLAGYAAFSASEALIRALKPADTLEEALRLQARTTEARHLLSIRDDVTIGGARDISPQVDLARRGGVLEPADLLDVKNTLIAARTLARSFERQQANYPTLYEIASGLVVPPGLVDSISRTISERGEVLDSASDKLSALRRDLKIAHDRLMSKLERLVNDPRSASMLQEPIITQRNGRYVIPLKADFKGRVRSIVHDQSASGATLFVEPLVVVEMNNQCHELELAERDEVRRILAELSAQVGNAHAEINGIVTALAELDLAFSCARYADDLRACEPVLTPYRKTQGEHPGSTIKLYHARHPLLDPNKVVPIDVDLDNETFAVVITGPNTGGKTVTLKTVGLLALMAQSGLHIPAQSGAELSFFNDIFADIGDEQSIEQSLSTFSGHITNIVRVLNLANNHTLVLFDELGAGTDPQEGAALARAILEHLVNKRVPCFVATHYPELKAYAHSTRGTVNASMEFDLTTLRPTYHLTIGLPGRSNALLIAERLGLAPEIIEAARGTIDPNDLRAEDLLDEIHRQRDLARSARDMADIARRDAERIRRELALRLEKVEDERMALLNQARSEAEKEAAGLRQELEDLRKALIRARQPLDALKPVVEQVQSLQERVESPVERRAAEAVQTRPLKLGDRVRVRSLQMDGLVTALGEDDVEVQLGNLRVRAKTADLGRPGEPEEPAVTPGTRRRKKSEPAGAPTSSTIVHVSPGVELDLRGQRAEDALPTLERYLEQAYLAGLIYVRIIHGKGTGRLRQAVREMLQESSQVKRIESGGEKEGGEGVTVAFLDTN